MTSSNTITPERLPYEEVPPLFNRLDYTVRRYFVDEFLYRHVKTFSKSDRILDIGGKKISKRGQFNIEEWGLDVKYANIDPNTKPDILCDAARIPTKGSIFDGVICSELFEHVRSPESVLKEAYRILRPMGVLLICVPFLYKLHADPHDYGRYTETYWQETLREIGFTKIEIEKQGLFLSVLMDMLKNFAYEMQKEGRPRSTIIRVLFHKNNSVRTEESIQTREERVFQESSIFQKLYNWLWD
jgi:SAM-dependent methyltransferase